MSNTLTPIAPSDLTAAALNRATGEQLRFWIKGANDAATKDVKGKGKKVMLKSGKVEDLKVRLAEFYGIGRKAPKLEPASDMSAVDHDIHRRQWKDWRVLGEEWLSCAAAGHKFKLSTPSSIDKEGM